MKVSKASLKSFKDLYNNPIILLPDLAFFFILVISNFIFYKVSRLQEFITKYKTLEAAYLKNPAQLSSFSQFFASDWIKFFIALSIYFLFAFFVGVGFQVVKYLLMKDSIQNKKHKMLKRAIELEEEYYFKLAILNIYTFLVNTAVFFLTLTLFLILYFLDIRGLPLILPVIIFGLMLSITAKLGLMYRHAIIFLTKTKRPSRVILKSFRTMLDHVRHSLTLALSFVAAGIILYISTSLITNSLPSLNWILGGLYYFVMFMINKIYTAWIDLVIFNDIESKLKD